MPRSEASTFDAIVVGSGITGGWAAKELCELGLRTLVLEAGRPLAPERDYSEHRPIWDMPFRGLGDRRYVERHQRVQRHSVSFDEWNHLFWTDDLENPYTTPQGKPFSWLRARQVGGKSTIWGRQVYRWSDLDFEANLRDGLAVDWPIRYADIAPWYDYVESFIGVSGRREGLAQVPDGRFLPPMPFNCVEEHVAGRIHKAFPGERLMTIGRVAILTAPLHGRAACHYCGPCFRGCITRSYFSALNSTLPAAEATGRMTLRPFSIVRHLTVDRSSGKVTGAHVIDARTRESHEFRARIVFLCASALESARILLNSRTPDAPSGLANSSDQVGRNIMDHIKWGGADGQFEGWTDRDVSGVRPNGIYIPRFRNLRSRHPDFIRGYGFQGGASRQTWQARLSARGIGSALKRKLTELGPWIMSLKGFGEMLPNPQNRCTLHPTAVDAWGIPVLHIECAWGPNELAIHHDMNLTAAEMLESAGATNIRMGMRISTPGNTNHEMGAARMGRNPKTSVLNGWNQAWDVPNMFVTDGACMASSGNQNPSLTYMALTARACHYAVAEMRRGNL
jgi:choline dehydrogenase-like flavoprotein